MITSQAHSKPMKKTPLGWIPKEWPVISLGSATVKVGSGITPKGGESAYLPSGIPLIRSQNVLWGKLDLGEVAFIPKEQHESMSGTKVQYRDVLLNITGASIGRSCVFEEKGQEANVNQHVCIIRPTDTLDPSYLCAILLSAIGQKQIDSYQGGGNREGLNFEQIRNFIIPLPPLREQRKIAVILSAWNHALEKIEALIDTKERFKRGLMQTLLTGKKRFGQKTNRERKILSLILPQDWGAQKLGELALIKDGTHFTPQYTESGIPFLRVTDIVNGVDKADKKFISMEEHKELTRRFKPGRGDILYSKNGTIGVPKLIDWDWEFSIFVSLAAIRIRDVSVLVPRYLEAWLGSDAAKNEIRMGSKQGTVINLHLEEIEKFRIPLPPLPEQKRIADCLGALDREISLLKNKAARFREQKNGLMQKLLTGAVRVKV